MAYTKEETTTQLDSIIDKMNDFYKNCPYRKGNLKKDKISSDEFIAKYIIDNLVFLNNGEYLIRGISDDKRNDYFDKARKDIDKKKGSKEEIFQRHIYFDKKLDNELEEKFKNEDFIWFEFSGYPKIGKGIDLISYDKSKKVLTLYELKFGDVNEHLLKAILEIQTYYQRTRYDKLKKDWKKFNYNCNKPKSHYELLDLDFNRNSVKKALLLDRRTLAYKQYCDEHTVYMSKLLELFDITVIAFDGDKYQI